MTDHQFSPHAARDLKRTQIESLRYIASFTADHGYPPTIRQLSAYFGVKSTNAISDRLWRLEARGLITRDAFKSRALRLTELGYAVIGGKPAIACGPGGPLTGFCDPPTMRCQKCARVLFGNSHLAHKCLAEDEASVRGAA